jgi:hypothetical protein
MVCPTRTLVDPSTSHFRCQSQLRKQPGFRDEVTFLPADGSGDAVAISFWEKRENADAYQRGAYPEVLKAVAKVADGTPNVQTSEVSNSTWLKIAAQ